MKAMMINFFKCSSLPQQQKKLQIQKKQLRQKLLRQRLNLSPTLRKKKSKKITEQLLKWPGLASVNNIFCYLDMPGEVETRGLIQALLARGKSVAVPQITGPGQMRAVSLTSLEKLESGPYQIPVPRIIKPFTEKIELNLAPAAAVDKEGRRLGQGGGYYDRFIERYQPLHNLALVFAFQVLELVPAGPSDKLMDTIVTEEAIYEVIPADSN